jgi:hypothetical protein
MTEKFQCLKCRVYLELRDTYEYRGAYACAACFDEVIKNRDRQRNEIIEEENAKTEVFKGLDLGDSKIGKANREILAAQIEIANKERGRLALYEGRKKK